MTDLPRYRCHKEVSALKIADGMFEVHSNQDVTVPIGDGGFPPYRLKAEVVVRRFPQAGDYIVIYEDGYVSLSPAKAFEEGYTRI